MNTVAVDVISRRPTAEEAPGLPARYKFKALTPEQKMRRLRAIVKLLAETVVFFSVGFLGYFWNSSFASGEKGLLVGASWLLCIGGFALGAIFALLFLFSLMPGESAAPKKPEKLAKYMLGRMMDGINLTDEGKTSMVEEFLRTLPEGSPVTGQDILKFISLKDGQYDGLWGRLWSFKNSGWSISCPSKVTVTGTEEIAPDIFQITATAVCDYTGSLKKSAGGQGGAKSVTYRQALLHAELRAKFVFVHAEGRWFNYDYSPKVVKHT